MGEKLGAQFWGFELLLTPALSSTGKTLETVDEKLPCTCIFFLFFKPVGEPMGLLTSAGP